jgi:hypothetical protein
MKDTMDSLASELPAHYVTPNSRDTIPLGMRPADRANNAPECVTHALSMSSIATVVVGWESFDVTATRFETTRISFGDKELAVLTHAPVTSFVLFPCETRECAGCRRKVALSSRNIMFVAQSLFGTGQAMDGLVCKACSVMYEAMDDCLQLVPYRYCCAVNRRNDTLPLLDVVPLPLDDTLSDEQLVSWTAVNLAELGGSGMYVRNMTYEQIVERLVLIWQRSKLRRVAERAKQRAHLTMLLRSVRLAELWRTRGAMGQSTRTGP